LCYILSLRAIRAGRCRERRYADHIFIQIYFRMRHFVVKLLKFFSPQAARGIDPPNQNPADIPVCQRTPRVIGVARYPWGTCPLDFEQFTFGTLLCSCIKYHVNFLRQVSSGLRTILTKIKLNVFFYFIEKHENDVSFFRYGVFLFSSHFTCVTLKFHVVFCPSSRLILATPLPRIHRNFFLAGLCRPTVELTAFLRRLTELCLYGKKGKGSLLPSVGFRS